jgi:hypothetical protein
VQTPINNNPLDRYSMFPGNNTPPVVIEEQNSEDHCSAIKMLEKSEIQPKKAPVPKLKIESINEPKLKMKPPIVPDFKKRHNTTKAGVFM